MKGLLTLLVCFAAYTTVFSDDIGAGTQPDNASRKIYSEIGRNLDSLMRLSYLQFGVGGGNTVLSDQTLPDSVYRERFEKIPLFVRPTFHPEVGDMIRFLTSTPNKAKIEVMMGLAQKHYLPVFESILREYQLPLELKYFPLALSALFPEATSSNGASGIWLLPYTIAKRYGLNITSYTDERRDPVKSTHAAAKYLREMYGVYHDWVLAIAAFNCGPANVNKAIQRNGGERDFWKIYPGLPEESRDYVPAFMSMVYLMHFYESHNFTPCKVSMPANVDTLVVEKKLHLGQVSSVLRIPMKMLTDLNPEYRKNIIQPVNDNNTLKIPSEYSPLFMLYKDSIYNYRLDSYFVPPVTVVEAPVVSKSSGSSTYNASHSSSSASLEPVDVKNMDKIYYTVKSGDNTGLIAQWYDVTVSDLKHWNNLYYKKYIMPGQKLVIYKPLGQGGRYAKINTMSFEEKQKQSGHSLSSGSGSSGSTVNKTSSTSGSLTSSGGTKSSGYVYYTVKSGDSLWSIAQKFDGVSVDDLKALNRLGGSYKLYPGQVLKIKRK